MSKRKKAVLTGIAAILVLAVALGLLQELLRPKYGYGNIPEGTLIADYYDEAGDHDVIFIGDCQLHPAQRPAAHLAVLLPAGGHPALRNARRGGL